jgi:hypothetical protein
LQRVIDGVFYSHLGRADQIDYFINVIFHKEGNQLSE